MYKKLATLVFIFNTHSPIFADDIINEWGELEDALFSEDTTMSFEDTSLEEGQTRAIYRVRISETE